MTTSAKRRNGAASAWCSTPSHLLVRLFTLTSHSWPQSCSRRVQTSVRLDDRRSHTLVICLGAIATKLQRYYLRL